MNETYKSVGSSSPAPLTLREKFFLCKLSVCSTLDVSKRNIEADETCNFSQLFFREKKNCRPRRFDVFLLKLFPFVAADFSPFLKVMLRLSDPIFLVPFSFPSVSAAVIFLAALSHFTSAYLNRLV